MKLFLLLLCLGTFILSLPGLALADGAPRAFQQSVHVHSDSLILSPSTTFTTTNGTWGNNPTSFAYQWMDCRANGTQCINIAGATSVSYTVTNSDIGFAIEVNVTASNASGSASQHSAPTGVISIPPTNTTVPTISGTTQQGQTLTATNGTWANSPTSYADQWQRCTTSSSGCTTISGSPTTNSYTLVSADVGNYIRVGVAATNTAGTSSYAYSVETSVVTAVGSPPANTVIPAVSGPVTVGSAESTTSGTWTGSPTSYTYQWGKQNPCGAGAGTNISGATSTTYTPVAGDVGFGLYVAVTATNAFGSTTAFSSCTSPVVAGGGGGGGSSGYTGPCNTTINPSTTSGAVASAEAGLNPGQVLCLNSGTYGTTSGLNMYTKSGTAGNPIIVTSGPGQTATLVGAEYVGGSFGKTNYVTLENLNIDNSNNQYSGYGGAVPSPCPIPVSEGMQLDGNGLVLQNNNIYHATDALRDIDVLIGSQTSGGSFTISHNKISNAGSCGQTQHLIYVDNVSSGTINQNWLWDTAFGACVQLYPNPANTTVSSNVMDGCITGTFDWNGGSNYGGNTTTHNVIENTVTDPTYSVSGSPFASNKGVLCTGNSGPTETVTNNAIFNVSGGMGAACSGFNTSGNQTLSASPFVNEHSHNYNVAAGSAGTPVAGYGLWDGVGPPTPDPAPLNSAHSGDSNNNAYSYTNP